MKTPDVSFKGIYGTATTVDNKEVPIKLEDRDINLFVSNFSKDLDGNDIFFVKYYKHDNLGSTSINGDESTFFKKINIDKVTASSRVTFSGFVDMTAKIGTLMDKSKLILRNSTAIIDKILGKNVSIGIEQRYSSRTGFNLKENSSHGFRLEGVVCGGNTRVTGSDVFYYAK